MAPLGKYRNAVRNGAPVAVTASLPADDAAKRRAGSKEANAGNATLAPKPRRKCRRVRPGGGWTARPSVEV